MAQRLMLLALFCVVPLLGGAAVLGVVLHREESTRNDARLRVTARVAAEALDAEIASRRLALRVFGEAISGTGALADLRGLDAAARRIAEALGAPVHVLDRGLGLLVDTSQPFGTPLASTPAVAAGLWAVETGRPTVSDVLSGPGGAAQAPMLLLPVLREGRTEVVLGTMLDGARLAGVIDGLHAALFDSRGRRVAGDAAGLPDWPVLLTAGHGMVRPHRSSDGTATRYAASFLTAAPDWRLVAWERTSAARPPLLAALPWTLGGLAAALLVMLIALRVTISDLRRPVLEYARHARASAEAGRGDGPLLPVPLPPAPMELADLGAALAEAQEVVRLRERRLRALAEAGALVLWRADAAGGWVDAEGWAGLTGQAASACRGDGWIEMLHPDDRAPTLAEWGRSLVARSQIGVEFRLRSGDGAEPWRWVRATGVPVATDDGKLLEWVGAIHEVGDARGAANAQRVNEAQVRQTVAELRAVYDTVPVGLALVDPALRFVNVNARFAAIGGLPTEAHIGRAAHEVMPEGLAAPLEAAQREVLTTGRPVLDVTCASQAPGAVQHIRHWLASLHPVKDAAGAVTGVSAVLQDVTERIRAERSRELLVADLNHRVKNTLARVQAIAAQSLRREGTTATGFGRDFVGRLQALTRSHELLTAAGWQPVDLLRVVQVALAPWLEGGRALRISGSGRIQIDPPQAEALVLALHELATNAVRHGALSRPGGEVEVTWSLGEDAVVRFDWRESGGPPVAPPAPERRGFGMRLLERGLAHDLGPGADVRLSFAEEGLRLALSFRVGMPSLAVTAKA